MRIDSISFVEITTTTTTTTPSTTTTEIDPCHPNPCNTTNSECKVSNKDPTDYRCKCLDGFERKPDSDRKECQGNTYRLYKEHIYTASNIMQSSTQPFIYNSVKCIYYPTTLIKISSLDIDECEDYEYHSTKRHYNSLCDQLCVNTYGSYHCDCKDGYVIGDDGRTCHGNHFQIALYSNICLAKHS